MSEEECLSSFESFFLEPVIFMNVGSKWRRSGGFSCTRAALLAML